MPWGKKTTKALPATGSTTTLAEKRVMYEYRPVTASGTQLRAARVAWDPSMPRDTQKTR